MMGSNILKKHKSSYNPNCTSYLTADGKYYCYQYWDDNAKCMTTERLEVGKDVSFELASQLAEFDHDEELQNRYADEMRDSLFDTKMNRYKADPDDENAVDPWNMIADKKCGVEGALFAEPEVENCQTSKVRRVIDESFTPAQQDFFFEHFGMGLQLEKMRQAEAEHTGKMPSAQAFTNRKNKIIDKTAKALGVERVKRHAYSKFADA